MASLEIPVTGHLVGTDVQELRHLRLWQKSVDTGVSTEGAFWFNSNVGDKRIKFYDGTTGSAIVVPRLDRDEIWTGVPAFNRTGSNPPFTANQTLPSVGSTATRVENLNAHYLGGYLPDASATLSTIALRDGAGRVTGADPVGDTDLVNLRYIRGHLRSADDKGSVRCATVAALPSYTFSANVLTASANGALTVDGITVANNDVIAVMWEGSGSANYYLGGSNALNGIYTVTDKGSGSTPWILTRYQGNDISANITSEITSGMFFHVAEGTALQNSVWSLFTNDPIYLRTDAPKTLTATAASGGTLSPATYYYRVTFVDYLGGENATTLETSGVTITSSANKTIDLSWASYSSAVSYRIYRTTTSGTYGATTLVGTTTGTTFSDTGISATTGTPPTGSELQFGLIGSNTFYSAGNGIQVSGQIISVLVSASTTYTQGGILYHGSTTTISSAQLTGVLKGNGTSAPTAMTSATNRVTYWSDANTITGSANLTFDGSTLTVTGAATISGTTTLATSLTGMLKGASGVVSAVTSATNRVTYWSDANTITGSANLTFDGSTLTVTGAATISGNVGIGTTGPSYKLDILSGSGGVPQLLLSDITTDATEKVSTVIMRHFTNSEEPVCILNTVSRISATGNNIQIGGGRSTFNAAKAISFFTAANGTTLTGTERMTIDGSGNVGISALTASMLVQTDGSKNLVSSNSLPSATTLAGATICRKYSTDIGDGSTTSFTVTHSLATNYVTVSITDASTGENTITYWKVSSSNAVVIEFITAPTSNQYRVTVTG